MSRAKRKHNQGGVIAVDGSLMPMCEIRMRKALKALATGKAYILDLRTWARLGVEHLGGLQDLKVVVYPHARVIPDARLGLGRGNVGILRRDGYICQVEGCTRKGDTVDHLRPRAQGGRSEWNNLCAMCFDHNQAKGPRTLEQAGMRLKRPIRSPRYTLIERFNELAMSA